MATKRTVSQAVLKQSAFIILVLLIPLGILLLIPPFLDFQKDILEYERIHIEKTKLDIKEQIKQAIVRLSFDHLQIEIHVKDILQEQVHIAHAIATKIYEQNKNRMTDKELQSLVRETLRVIRFNGGRGYFFATDFNGIEQLFADKPELEGKNLLGMQDTNGKYVIRDMIGIARSKAREGFYDYTWTKPDVKGKNFRKLSFIKYFAPFDWFIGTGEYLDTVEAQIKTEAVVWLDHIKYGKDNYLFAFEYGGKYVAHVGKNIKNKAVDANYWNLKDINGVLINQELQRQAQKGGGFVEYVWHKPSTGKVSPKLAYAEAFKPWGWVIGTGVYLDDVKKEIAAKRAEMWRTTWQNVVFLVIVLGVALMLALLIAMRFSNKIQKELNVFSNFFQRASTESEEIIGDKLQYDGFKSLANIGNDMLAKRKQAEEALSENEKRFRFMVKNSSDILVLISEDGVQQYVSSVAERITGFLPSELVGKALPDIIHPDDISKVMEAWNIALEHPKQVLNIQYRHKHKTRGWVHLEAIAQNFLAESTVKGIVASVRDITERKKKQEESHRLLIAIEQSPETILITDINGIIQYVNPAFEVISGYSAKEAIGVNPSVLQSGKHNDAFYDELWGKIKNGEVWKGQFINKRKDGIEYYEDSTISPVLEDSGKIINYVAIKRDVTKELALKAQFHQAQRMESVGRLAGGVAHDFNNLLTGITGNVQLAQMDISPTDPLNQTLSEINAAANRAAELTHQLLAFSRKQIIKPKVINLNNLIENMHKMLGRIIGEDVDIKNIPMKGLGQIKADPGQVEQIIVNLAVNARDAMPNGGKLTIKTADINLDGEYCKKYPHVLQGNYVMLTISDNGDGMDEETQNSIFDPFFTTKPEGQGTGLGLATVYGIVKQHNGYIEVYSELGKGTTFKVYFPLVLEKAETIIRTSPLSNLPHGTETVFIVEDESMVRKIAIKILTRLGYNIISAEDGVHALASINSEDAPINLLLTDIVMPKMNGRELAEKLQKQYPEMKVLFTSGYTEDVIAHHGILDEGLEFIGKPYTPQALAEKVRKVLDM